MFMDNKFAKINLPPGIILMIISAFLVNAGLWIYTWLAFKRASDIIPLHYSIYFGTDLIGSKSKLFILPGAAGLFLIIDFFLASLFRKKDPLASVLLIVAGTCLQAIAFVASIPIIHNIG